MALPVFAQAGDVSVSKRPEMTNQPASKTEARPVRAQDHLQRGDYPRRLLHHERLPPPQRKGPRYLTFSVRSCRSQSR